MKRLLFVLVAVTVLASTRTAVSQPMVSRYAGLSGLYTMPFGDFDKISGDGWGILIMGEQFLNASRLIAATSDVGYLDFGSKSVGSTKTDINMFPVQFGLRVYPLVKRNPNSKAQLFGEGALGFYYTRTEVETGFLAQSDYDYYFGVNTGAGIKLAANPKVSLLFDATWNWVFATGTDPNYLALRGALIFPIGL